MTNSVPAFFDATGKNIASGSPDQAKPGDGPGGNQGAFADAARAREEDLARRLEKSVDLDRSFQSALNDVYQHNLQSRQRLGAIEAEIRQAAAWPGRNTPAGEKQFQQYLIGKTRDIEKVVDTARTYSQEKARTLESLTAQYSGLSGSGR